jgi:hypothetical protein
MMIDSISGRMAFVLRIHWRGFVPNAKVRYKEYFCKKLEHAFIEFPSVTEKC